jgi:hypothetical protein
MAQPVKLSDQLVVDARLSGEINERSIAGQVEFWARLGRAAERILRTDHLLMLKRMGDTASISQSLEAIGTAKGRQRLAQVLQQRSYPHFEAAEGRPGFVVKIDADGRRTVGRFVRRVFTPAECG